MISPIVIKSIKGKYEALRDRLDERERRIWAATEAIALGWGGTTHVAMATGISRTCIHTGIRELRHGTISSKKARKQSKSEQNSLSHSRVRRAGGGRKRLEDKYPEIISELDRMLANEVAGDPMNSQKWVRSSSRNLSKRLATRGYRISAATVCRLLKKMGFSLKSNKRREIKRACPERDEQFKYIGRKRKAFKVADLPIISVDSKKKELIGEFRNSGQAWCREAAKVHEHDYPSFSKCRATPFGVYDVTKNRGYVYVGTSSNTPEFAVDNITQWWRNHGRFTYPKAKKLLILADSGGNNGCRVRAWKHNLQNKLCNEFGLKVTVCHYPTACSKWNPIEHRLFSYISMNWAGKPLSTLDVMLGYISSTTTSTGLKVKGFLQDRVYETGERVSAEDIKRLNIQMHKVCSKWNYTLGPARKGGK